MKPQPLPSCYRKLQATMEQYIDFAKIRQEFSDDLIIEWDDTKLIGQNILHLFDEYFSLPCAHIQLPLLAAYWSLPSTLCSVVPILFLDGTEGSGKSNISKIFANTHGVQPYSVATTYASLRNDIDTYRFKDAEHPNGYTVKQEKNFCLVFDNLNRETLSNENLLSLFLSGYDRQTANISISIEVGKNKQFNAFCPKVVSSVHNLLDEKRFRELKRRCIRIATKKADVLTEADMPNRIGLPPRSMEMVNFLWLKNHFTKFWMTYENIRCFGKVVKQVVGTSLKVPANRKVVYIDLIASGVVAGVWASIADAAEVPRAHATLAARARHQQQTHRLCRSRAQTWLLVGTLILLGVVGSGMAAYQRFVDPKWIMLGRTQAEQFWQRSAGMFGIPNSLAALLELTSSPEVAACSRQPELSGGQAIRYSLSSSVMSR